MDRLLSFYFRNLIYDGKKYSTIMRDFHCLKRFAQLFMLGFPNHKMLYYPSNGVKPVTSLTLHATNYCCAHFTMKSTITLVTTGQIVVFLCFFLVEIGKSIKGRYHRFIFRTIFISVNRHFSKKLQNTQWA